LNRAIQNVNGGHRRAPVPRPRTYELGQVVEAAKDAFWERGYAGTAMSDLEHSTGLNRSSLYLAFGSKRAIFELSLDRYTEEVIDRLVGGMETASAGLQEVVAFFRGLRDMLSRDMESHRGCLMVNTIAELAGRDEIATPRAVAFRDRLRRAFAHALEGAAERSESDGTTIQRRAWVLAAVTLGAWLSARIDPVDACQLCDEIVSEVESWHLPTSDASDMSKDTVERPRHSG
jgi:TetR/AcrR family transcriptional repressor of nem operon